MTLLNDDDPLSTSIATIHAAINSRHDMARARLLTSIGNESPTIRSPSTFRNPRLLVGGVVSALAATVAIVIALSASSPAAVAMEKLIQALDRVSGYTYRMEMKYVSTRGQGRTVQQVTFGSWRNQPLSMRASITINETLATSANTPGPTTTIVNIEESHLPNGQGVLVDHQKKEYWSISEPLNADSIPSGSPQTAIHMVQQRRGKLLRDLGQRQIDGRPAHGLELQFENAQPVSELGPNNDAATGENRKPVKDWRNMTFEVWVDTTTNLPIEFRTSRRGPDFETTFRFTDLKWNVAFPPDAFQIIIPPGYQQIEKTP
jgi:outer membrane lipoprotein-sorting protein